MIPNMLRKMAMTSTFRNRFQHIILQIVCLSISFASIYNIITFNAKWDRQIKVVVFFSKNIVRDIISNTVLKVKICEKKSVVCCQLLG